MPRRLSAAALAFAALLACRSLAAACACGCGIFDVQTGAVLPTHVGGFAFAEYDYTDQDRNRSGARQAPAEDNSDRRLRTDFFTLGGQYMLDRRWGIMAELPYWTRRFDTIDGSGPPASFRHGSLGDVRLRGIYSGFSPDMSAGLTFGVKLPTGQIHQNGLDRDTQIGTGSTDLLLGGYKMATVAAGRVGWYADGLYDQPVLTAGGYRPGAELDAALGAYDNDWSVAGVKVAPIAQAVASQRWSDQGVKAAPANTGYRRLALGPGLQLVYRSASLYGDVAFPVWQYVKGNQITAPAFVKIVAGYAF